MEQPDLEIDPDPNDLDAQAIADTIAAALYEVYESGRSQHIAFHTVRMGADLWRRYRIRFDNENKAVLVSIGPLVSTSQVPYEGTRISQKKFGSAPLPCNILQTYTEDTVVDIFSGPTIGFKKEGNDAIRAEFIPWHRRWSHSLTLALACGLVVGLILGPLAGLIAGSAFAVHVLEDQLGHMGSNLLFPLTKQHIKGLGWMRSGDPLPNMSTVWLAALLTLFNLDRFSTSPSFSTHPILFFTLGFVLPIGLIATLSYLARRNKHLAGPLAHKEAVSEMEEGF
jgi:hypothetical protein